MSLSTSSLKDSVRSLRLVATAALLVAWPGRSSLAEDFAACWEHYEASRWSEAAGCFEGLLAEFEGWAWGHHYLGVSLRGAGRDDEALVQLEKAMELMPSDEEPAWDPFFMAATLLEAKGQCRKAMDVLGRAEGLIPAEETAEATALRGRLHFCLENWRDAIQLLEKSGQRDFDTWYRRGVAQYMEEDYESASDALEEALALQPEHASTVEFLAKAFTKRAEATNDDRTRERLWARAAEIGRKMLASNPRSVEAHNLLARALMGAKDFAGAEREFKRVLELKPSHCFATFNLAQLHVKNQRWDAAVSAGGKASKCLSGDPKRNAYMIVGDALLGSAGQRAAALGDDDAEGRRGAISVYRQAIDQFRAARSIRASSGIDGKVAQAEQAIAGLEEAIATIEFNRQAEEANQAAAEEEKRQAELLEAARKGSGGSD